MGTDSNVRPSRTHHHAGVPRLMRPSDDVCTFVCSSRCLGDLGGLPEDSIPDCITACQMVNLYEDCEAEVCAFIGCLEANDCGSAGATACVDASLDFSMCFTPL